VNQLRIALAWALLGPPAALGQTSARPDPADPRVTTPPPVMESAFAGYRGYRDDPPAPWREVNDEVRELGGHAGHLRTEVPIDRGTTAGERPPAKPAAPATTGGKHAH